MRLPSRRLMEDLVDEYRDRPSQITTVLASPFPWHSLPLLGLRDELGWLGELNKQTTSYLMPSATCTLCSRLLLLIYSLLIFA